MRVPHCGDWRTGRADVPSWNRRIWLPFRFSNISSVPLGHVILSSFTEVALPNPK